VPAAFSRPATFATLAALLAATLASSGCGSAPPAAPPPPPVEEGTAAGGAQAGPELPAVEQEVGALNEQATTKAFFGLLPKMERCQQEGRARDERLEFLAGDVELVVHIRRDGGARRAFLAKSTLGDHAAEQCIVAAARAASWPRPEGGGDGVAKNAFQLPLRADRDAVSWNDAKIAPALGASARAFRACRRGNRSRIELTAYVDRDGTVIAAGASTPDGEADAVAGCMVKAAKGLKLPSPGGWPAKVTFAAP
jgi:hypothetical protein